MLTPSANTKNLDSYILAAAEREAELRPLLLFKGGFTEHRARTMFCLTQVLRDSNIPDVRHAIKLVSSIPVDAHRAGLHAKLMESSTWNAFLIRLKSAPKAFSLDPSLKEYATYLYYTLPARNQWTLTPIPEFARRSERPWRLIQKPPQMAEYYPFSHEESLSDNTLWLVHNAVPKGLTEDIRADVCQDLIVSILAGETSRLNIGRAVPKFLSRHRKMYGDRWRTVSIETPLFDKFGAEMPVTLKDYLKD